MGKQPNFIAQVAEAAQITHMVSKQQRREVELLV